MSCREHAPDSILREKHMSLENLKAPVQHGSGATTYLHEDGHVASFSFEHGLQRYVDRRARKRRDALHDTMISPIIIAQAKSKSMAVGKRELDLRVGHHTVGDIMVSQKKQFCRR